MTPSSERKARSREIRREGYVGIVPVLVHESAVDRLIAMGELAEEDSHNLKRIGEAFGGLINAGALEGAVVANPGREDDPTGGAGITAKTTPDKPRRKVEDPLFLL